MLNVETFSLGPLQTNAHLLTLPGQENCGIIVDPGADPQVLIDRIADMDIAAILLTHAHFDHIAGVDAIRKNKRCPVYIHSLEADWLQQPELNGSLRWPEVSPPIITDPAEYLLVDGQSLELMDCSFQVLHTPGHSPGSVSYLHGRQLFSGDVLFHLSAGRTDLPGGNHQQLVDSIQRKLYALDDGVEVHPGHGPATSIGFEKRHNPYVPF